MIAVTTSLYQRKNLSITNRAVTKEKIENQLRGINNDEWLILQE